MRKFKLYISALVLVLASVASVPVSNTFAADPAAATDTADCDEQFYSSNDILFYNPCATSCSAGGGAGSGTVSALRGANNGEKIFNFWVDSGMSAQQAAGVTGSMKHEGGFSPFRQEMSQTWPAGGWGIAQFTWDPGQRGNAKAFVRDAIGASLFDQYYKNDYGGGVSEANGFIPEGVPVDVNDKFLLAQLNYLLTYIKGFEPASNSTRTSRIKSDYNQDVPSGKNLYEYLTSLVQAGDVAIAWTYLYEYPGDIKATAAVRANSAADIVELYSNGISTSCGGNLVAGGMNLEQAIKFMEDYKTGADSATYIGGAGQDCPGGPLSNCVSFSTYFINKYTTLKGFGADRTAGPGNGSTVVANIIARNPDVANGHSPRPYAIFSTPSGSMMCGDVKCGHTGVILGVDTAGGKVIVGEASCGGALDWDTAREYDLSQFDSDAYTYAYTEGVMKGTVQ
jgi:hypothetical protein